MTTLVLTFASVPILGKDLVINVTAAGVGVPEFSEEFVTLRTGHFLSTAPIGISTDDAAANYAEAYNLDFRNQGGINSSIATVVGNVVTITFNIASWQVLTPTGTAIDDLDVTYVINNDPVEDDKTVTIVDFEAHVPDPCGFCLVNIEATGGNDVYDVYEYPSMNQVLDDTSSPFQLQVIRGAVTLFRVTDSTGVEIGIPRVTAPKQLSSKGIDVAISNFASGATVNISVEFISEDILPYTYSLDDITYQSSNIFSGLPNDSYTIYVKDDFGCVKNKDFVIDGATTIPDTIFTISNINALRWSLIDSNKKNHKNTLSCNELKRITYPFIHKFTVDDVITTQFKTNAQYINVYAIDPNAATTPLAAVQMTDNTGISAKSTCTYFDWGNGQSAVYFGVVDILNPLTDAVIETTDFGFTLPEWANTVGNLVTVDIPVLGDTELPIDAIGYSEFYESFVIVFNLAYTGAAVVKDLAALYNIQPYEVYEFEADMSALYDFYNIVIEVGADSDNIDFRYISEKVKQFTDTDRFFEIIYFDTENRGDMVYQTGITHKLRLEGAVDYIGEQETEGYNGDTDFFVTDNIVYDSQKFVFYRLSSEMVHKLRLMVSHPSLNINGLFYKLAEVPEVKTDINNNLKTFSVILKQGGDQFLTDDQEIINVGARGVAESEAIAAALAASEGEALLLWTKTSG